jgi:hypothetical protein
VIKTETSLRLNRALVQTENSSHVHDTYSQPVCIFLTQIVSKQDRKIRLLSLVNFAKWRKIGWLEMMEVGSKVGMRGL